MLDADMCAIRPCIHHIEFRMTGPVRSDVREKVSSGASTNVEIPPCSARDNHGDLLIRVTLNTPYTNQTDRHPWRLRRRMARRDESWTRAIENF
jgi:hypothetical protein